MDIGSPVRRHTVVPLTEPVTVPNEPRSPGGPSTTPKRETTTPAPLPELVPVP